MNYIFVKKVRHIIQILDVEECGSETEFREQVEFLYKAILEHFYRSITVPRVGSNEFINADLERSTNEHFSMKLVPEYNFPKPFKKPNLGGRWNDALKHYIKQPRHSDCDPLVFFEDEHFVIIYDIFPKAAMHLLVLPRLIINSLASIDPNNKKHVETLQGMIARAIWVQKKLTRRHPKSKFKMGFHAIPSMNLLHLHV
eukprot:UN29898